MKKVENKKPVKKNRVVAYLEKASDSSEVKAYASEWQVGIVIFWILTGISQLISMISGYGWFYNHVISLVGSHTTAVILSLILVIIIEFVANYLCFKAVKFCLKIRTEWATAIPVTILALVFYVFSFYNSTQGAALWASEATDNTTKLNENYNIEVSRIESVADEDQKEIRSIIIAERSNPQGWKSGKRNGIITEDQLNKIQKLNDQIFSIRQQAKEKVSQLKQEKQEKLAANDEEVLEKSKSYFAAMSALLILQLICNFFLQFSSEQIRTTKEETDTITLEKLKRIKQNAVTNFVRSVVNEASEHLKVVTNMEATDIDIDEVQSGLITDNIQPQVDITSQNQPENNIEEIQSGLITDNIQPQLDITSQSQPESSEMPIFEIEKKGSIQKSELLKFDIPIEKMEVEKTEPEFEEVFNYRSPGFNADWREKPKPATKQEIKPATNPATPILKTQGTLEKHKVIVDALKKVVPDNQTAGISNEQINKVIELLDQVNYSYRSRSLIQNIDRARKSMKIV